MVVVVVRYVHSDDVYHPWAGSPDHCAARPTVRRLAQRVASSLSADRKKNRQSRAIEVEDVLPPRAAGGSIADESRWRNVVDGQNERI